MYNTKTFLVTVTYGNRICYLRELLKRSFVNESIGKAIIVNNASCSPLKELSEEWRDRIHIINLDVNTGSANGYSKGIESALNSGAEYIWLMDDDNAPTPGSVRKLHSYLETLSTEIGKDRAAVLGFRPDHHANIAMGVPPSEAIPPRSSFSGFHIMRIPYKIWRKLPWGKLKLNQIQETVDLPYAPYGGFLAHRSVFETIGLPMKELILYADDTEYTWRLTQLNGIIRLVTTALLEDIEESWNLKKRRKNLFEGILNGTSNFRLYYSNRNQAYFDCFHWRKSYSLYKINKGLFMILLHFFAWRYNRKEQLQLVKMAIAHGESCELGINVNYPL